MRVLAASAMASILLAVSAVRAPAAAPVDLRTCADATLPDPANGSKQDGIARSYQW